MPITPLAHGLLATVTIVIFSTQAQANCLPQRGNELVCGDKRICVSGQSAAEEGFYDPNKCLLHKTVCSSLSKLADIYIGGSKDQEPEPGKGKIEIASAHRLPRVSRNICSSLGIPAHWCKNNIQRGGAVGSTHESCNAADFYVPGMPLKPKEAGREKRQRLANELAKVQRTGINVYPTGRGHVSTSKRECFYQTGGIYPTVDSCRGKARSARNKKG